MQRVKLLASGKVQGVGFRDFVCRIGNSLGLSGYAKNLPEGEVEIVAEGEGAQIDALKRRISIKMPLGISVEHLKTVEEKEVKTRSFPSFGVRY
jgi:acylphosphatase